MIRKDRNDKDDAALDARPAMFWRRIFDRMLWLNPTDNQGVRFLIEDVRARKAWKERHDI